MGVMHVDTSLWLEFHLYDIFEVSRGNKLDRGKMEDGDIAFVGRSAVGNGINARVGYVCDHEKYGTVAPYDAGCLTLALGGSIGSCFYQDEPFYTSQNVAVLIPDKSIGKYALLFAASVVTHTVQCGKYEAFTEELNKHLMTDFSIKLPVIPDGEPDWDYMEQYMKDVMDRQAHVIDSLTRISKEKHPVDVGAWGEFRVGELFDCTTTLSIPSKNDLSDGSLNYVTRSAENNGLSGTCGNEDCLNKGQCVTIGAEGFVAFWQNDNFVAGNKVYAIRHDKMTELSGLFVCSALNTLSGRYSFSDARVLDRIKDEIIRLPVTPSGEPDWSYMEQYMRTVMDRQSHVIRCLAGLRG